MFGRWYGLILGFDEGLIEGVANGYIDGRFEVIEGSLLSHVGSALGGSGLADGRADFINDGSIVGREEAAEELGAKVSCCLVDGLLLIPTMVGAREGIFDGIKLSELDGVALGVPL